MTKNATSLNELFQKRLREALKVRGMNQQELAEQAGLKVAAINHFACGRRKPSAENLVRLADAIEVSTDFLLGRSNDLKPCGPATADLLDAASGLKKANLNTLTDIAQSLAKRK